MADVSDLTDGERHPPDTSPRKTNGDAGYPAPPLRVSSEVEFLALVHVGRDVAVARRFHYLELGLEDARGVLVLVGPLEPDRHRDALEFLEVRYRQPVDL